MATFISLNGLLIQEIKDLYNAETRLLKALPKMAGAASDAALKDGFEIHLEETKIHVERLEQVASILGVSPKGRVCKAMKGLVEEGSEAIGNDGDPGIKDLALIAAARRVEHYEIAGYSSARAIAETLGLADVVALLQSTLDEENAADETLTGLAEDYLTAIYGETADV